MLTDDKAIDLWKKISNEFNVHVRSVGAGLDNGDEITVVIVDDKTDPAIIQTLPQTFANERVKYQTGGPVNAQKDCGQPGHQCVCGTGTPKP